MAKELKIEDSSFREGLAAHWQEGELCDVEIVVEDEGRTLQAHRIILASASPYFNSMFMGSFRESTERQIHMKEITYEALYSIINCIYTKKITLNPETVGDVLSAADMLQMPKIFEECKKYMVTNISKKSCFVWMELFERYGITEGEKKAKDVVLNNLRDVCKTDGFLTISKVTLCSYLENEELKVGYEMDVFQAARRWLEHDPERLRYAAELMKYVAFAEIPTQVLTDEVGNVEFMFRDHACRKLLFETFKYKVDIYGQPLYRGTVNKLRGKPVLVCAERGTTMMKSGKELLRIRENMSHLLLCPLQHGAQNCIIENLGVPLTKWSVSLVTCGNFLFVFGVNSKTLEPVAKRFEPMMLSWIDLKPYHEISRVGVAVALVGDVIILAGGMIVERKDTGAEHNGEKIVNHTLIYKIKNNYWRKGKNMTEAIVDAKACAQQNVMYIAGGITSTLCKNQKMWAFDTQADIWMTKPKLLFSEKVVGIAAVENSIVAVHGEYGINVEVEMFSVVSNQWTSVKGPIVRGPVRGYSIESAVAGLWFQVDSKLYVFDRFGSSPVCVDSDGYAEYKPAIRTPKGKGAQEFEACTVLTMFEWP